jgi:hypothetical protein
MVSALAIGNSVAKDTPSRATPIKVASNIDACLTPAPLDKAEPSSVELGDVRQLNNTCTAMIFTIVTLGKQIA